MELKTDAILKGPIWADTLERLVGTVFKTYWDVYALSISIGMMHDCQIESDDMVPEGYDAEPKSVPRTVLGHSQNKALLEFMLQAAMITTKHLDLDENERLEIAFNDDKKPEFNPVASLTKYANYGITMIKDVIDDTDDIEMLEALMTFLNSTYETGVAGIDGDNVLEDFDE